MPHLRLLCSVFLVLVVQWFPPTVAEPLGKSTQLEPSQEAMKALAAAEFALDQGAFDQAELQLERVLLLMPDHAEARLMLASLMARLGRLETALLLVKSLIDDPETPSGHQARLRSFYALLIQAPRMASVHRLLGGDGQLKNTLPSEPPKRIWRSEISIGANSNPLARTRLGELPLTIGDSIVLLPIADRPEIGRSVGATLGRWSSSDGFDLSVQRVEHGASILHAGRLAAWGPLYEGLSGWSVSALQGVDGQRRYNAGINLSQMNHRLYLGRFWEPTRADLGSFVRYEYAVPASAGLSFLPAVERSLNQGNVPPFWRAGLSGEFALGYRRFLSAQWTIQQDLEGYSPLLANDLRRRLTTYIVAGEQQFELAKGKTLVFRALATQRKSNLELFAFKDMGLQVSFVATWQ